jgi:hypothetical protein
VGCGCGGTCWLGAGARNRRSAANRGGGIEYGYRKFISPTERGWPEDDVFPTGGGDGWSTAYSRRGEGRLDLQRATSGTAGLGLYGGPQPSVGEQQVVGRASFHYVKNWLW